MDATTVSVIVSATVPVLGVAVSYGVLRARQENIINRLDNLTDRFESHLVASNINIGEMRETKGKLEVIVEELSRRIHRLENEQ